jgi:hypothetical protein
MIYLQRKYTSDDGSQSVEIAVIENERLAASYEARGYSRCSLEAFRAAWRQRDERTLAHMRAALAPNLERAVGLRGVYAVPS